MGGESSTKVRQHTTEYGESCGRLLVETAERGTWKRFQVIKGSRSRNRHLGGIEMSDLEVLPIYHYFWLRRECFYCELDALLRGFGIEADPCHAKISIT